MRIDQCGRPPEEACGAGAGAGAGAECVEPPALEAPEEREPLQPPQVLCEPPPTEVRSPPE
jgi:hypothetical protein